MELPLWKLGKVAKVQLVLKGPPHKWILNARLIAKKGFEKMLLWKIQKYFSCFRKHKT